MKKIDRKVTLLCPICGNDQFEPLDEEFEDLLHASDDVRVDELAQDASKELEKELKKAMKKWKF